jgi:hypothetical protein
MLSLLIQNSFLNFIVKGSITTVKGNEAVLSVETTGFEPVKNPRFPRYTYFSFWLILQALSNEATEVSAIKEL